MNALLTTWRGVRLRAQIATSRHTAWPFVAGACLLLSLLLYAALLTPLRRDVVDLRERVTALPAPVTAAPPTAAQDDKGASIDRQVALVLGDEATLTGSLERLFGLAKQHGLRLRRAEYKPSNVRVLSVQAVQVSVPFEGDYTQLRAWMFDVLASMPQASIDRIAYRREQMTASRLEADIVLTLWRQDSKRASAAEPAASATGSEGRP